MDQPSWDRLRLCREAITKAFDAQKSIDRLNAQRAAAEALDLGAEPMSKINAALDAQITTLYQPAVDAAATLLASLPE